MNKLTEGMMWFCPDKDKAVVSIIKEAISYYTNKYNQTPDCVYMGSGFFDRLNEELGSKDDYVEAEILDFDIRRDERILKYHMWIGVSDDGSGSVISKDSAARSAAAV